MNAGFTDRRAGDALPDSPVLKYGNRPVYRLFDCLAKLSAGSDPEFDAFAVNFTRQSPELLDALAASTGILQRTIHLGTAAIGRCLALAAPEATDHDQCSPETVEAIGWLIAEMADLAAVCHHFEVTARRVSEKRAD
jgi:hypothetical protein